MTNLDFYHKLKSLLDPYVQDAIREQRESGAPESLRAPLLHAMCDVFADDPVCADPAQQAALGGQFMLGTSLLVAPSWQPDGTVRCYVPEGLWTRLDRGEQETGTTVSGGRWLCEQLEPPRVILLLRANGQRVPE